MVAGNYGIYSIFWTPHIGIMSYIARTFHSGRRDAYFKHLSVRLGLVIKKVMKTCLTQAKNKQIKIYYQFYSFGVRTV